jgi:hypothetical protein
MPEFLIFKAMNRLRLIPLYMAFAIAFGHSVVPHTHDEHREPSIHQHNEEHGFLDLVTCFFQTEHESEDLEHFVNADFSGFIASADVTVPIFKQRSGPVYPYVCPFTGPAFHDVPSLRGPPVG